MKTRQFRIIVLLLIINITLSCYFGIRNHYVDENSEWIKYRLETITQDMQLTNDHIANVYDWLKK